MAGLGISEWFVVFWDGQGVIGIDAIGWVDEDDAAGQGEGGRA